MKKILALFMLCAMLLSACGETVPAAAPADDASGPDEVCGVPLAPEDGEITAEPDSEVNPEPAFASDYMEIFKVISSRRETVLGGSFNDMAEAVPEEPSEDSAADAPGSGYSGTNVQVDGIDEGDIVKTDGEHIYILSDMELIIVKAAGSASHILSRTAIGESYSFNEKENPDGSWEYWGSEKYPRELLLAGERLFVISNASSFREYKSADGVWDYESDGFTSVAVYDVSDPSSPALLAELGQDGQLLGTRLYRDRVYVVSRYTQWSEPDSDDPGSYVPALYRNGIEELIAAEDICICPYGSGTDYIVAAVYEPESAECGAVQSILGAGDKVYMRGGNIYVAGTAYISEKSEPREESVYEVVDIQNRKDTSLFRLSAENGLKLEAQGLVPGYIESQFSVDEYEGFVRVVTTRNEESYTVYTDHEMGFENYVWDDEDQRTNGLYILDEGLNIVGSVEDLAQGETVYSARFDGGMAYFCTFEQVDPLFAVDVSDPQNPIVLSALKISGFSEYLHKWDENLLFGFGHEADEETGWTEGLKMVMFNTSNKADVTAEAGHVLEDCWYSEALYDHRAFFIEPERNIIGFHGDGDYHIYGYDAERGFFRRGYIPFDSWENRVRGMYIGESVYIVGTQNIYILDLENMQQEAKIGI